MSLDLLPRQRSPHLLAIDASYFVHRAFHACTRAGKPESAAPSAMRTFARFLRGRQPSHVLFAGEGLGSFRRGIWPAYKADRVRPPGLDACEAAVEVALQTAGATIVRAAGHEGDDVLWSAARLAYAEQIPAVLATCDKDVEQCVNDEWAVQAWDGDERVLDEAGVLERWGLGPLRLAELLALCGDSTDGVPGVPGWGKARALEVLKGAGMRRLDLLIQPGGEWFVPKKFRPKLIEHRETIRVCLQLVRLRVVRTPSLEELECEPLSIAESLVESADRIRP